MTGILCAIGVAIAATSVAEEAAGEAEQPVAAVQALLRQERLYSGQVDGVLGGETVAAIRRYQILHGLRATGRLDAGTLRAMLLPSQQPSEQLSSADRELLRELAEAPVPSPVAENRKPIPPAEPPVISPEEQKRAADAKGKKTGRPKSAKSRRSAPVRTISD